MAEQFTVRVENGYVKLFRLNGSFKRDICAHAVSAELKGDEVHVAMRDKSVKVYSVHGFYKRTL